MSSRRVPPALFKGLSLVVAVALVGSMAAIASAHGGDKTAVHSCVNSKGTVRLVDPSVDCRSGERSVDWAIEGPRGSIWHVGAGAPNSEIGVNGDLYLDTETGDVYVNVSGTWGRPVTNLKGPAGTVGTNSVGTDAIQDGAVTTVKIADDAVTSEKIADGTVTADDLATGAVTSDEIADGSVMTEDLADGSVTSEKIGDGEVAAEDLATGAVTEDKIAEGAVTSAAVANNSLTGDDIDESTLTGLLRAASFDEDDGSQTSTGLHFVDAGYGDVICAEADFEFFPGPSVTVTVGPSGLVAVYAEADMALGQPPKDEGPALVQLHEETDLPGCETILESSFQSPSQFPPDFERRTTLPASEVGTTGRGTWVIFPATPGTRTFSLRFGCGADPDITNQQSACYFDDLLLMVMPL